MPDAFVIDALRTPVGRYGGVLADLRPDDLAGRVIRAAVDRNGIDPERIDDVIFGDANQAGEDNRNVARMGALLAGLPVTVPGAFAREVVAVSVNGARGAEPRVVRVDEGRGATPRSSASPACDRSSARAGR